MDKKVVEVISNNIELHLYRGFLLIKDTINSTERKVSLDEILALVLSSDNIVISKNIINAICESGATIITCDTKYLPTTITLSYTGHWLVNKRIHEQIGCSVPLRKNLWKNIVQHKILNQASILEYFYPNNTNIIKLKRLSKDTLSDDSKNNEGQAAHIYFKSLFGNNFTRNRLKDDINILLNYAYIVLRAMVARAITGNGLLPYLGLKHCNKQNPMPLADDLIEPFRAIADKLVFSEIIKIGNPEHIELTPELKKNILTIITYPVRTTKGIMTLTDAIYDFVNSLVLSFETKKVVLTYPVI